MANKVEYVLSGNTAKLKTALADAEQATSKMSDSMKQKLTTAGAALAGVGVAAGALTKSFLDAQGRFEDIQTDADHQHAALMLRELVRSAAAARLDPYRLAALTQRWESVWSLLLADPLGARQ